MYGLTLDIPLYFISFQYTVHVFVRLYCLYCILLGVVKLPRANVYFYYTRLGIQLFISSHISYYIWHNQKGRWILSLIFPSYV